MGVRKMRGRDEKECGVVTYWRDERWGKVEDGGMKGKRTRSEGRQ